ncbi:MAG: thioesterase family protein [Micromonosporaceae bacterium]
MNEFEYDADTTVVAGETPGSYTATVNDRWSAVGSRPNGGYVLGIALRALLAEVSHPDPLVVSAYFLRPSVPGPVELTTEVVRAGRRISTGEVRVHQDGKETLRAVANFADLDAADGRTAVFGEPPKLPAPEDCLNLADGASIPGLTIADRFDYRYAEPLGWAQGTPSGEPRSELWIRFADGRDADSLSLPSIVDAAAPAVMELGEWTSSTIELTVHLRARPAPGWLACRISTRYVIGGYHEEDFDIWDATGALVAQGRQLALLPPAR